MEFDEQAQVDASSVDDVRGQGGGGFSFPGGGGAVGGGIVGLLLVVVMGFLGVKGGVPNFGGGTVSGDNKSLEEKCDVSNPDRFNAVECRQVATFNDLRDYWGKATPQTLGAKYSDPRLVFFTNGVSTGCGNASSAVGPFYCPADQRIYIDLGFYDQLASQFGAPGEFGQAYVLAHEFGHHMQRLTGIEQQVRAAQQRDPGRANAYSIALELQADCYAGVWAKNASDTGGLVTGISDDDIRAGLEAARAVGDDRIQEKAQGQVNPETWTHGSSEQRQQWFFRGYSTGDPRKCNTFG